MILVSSILFLVYGFFIAQFSRGIHKLRSAVCATKEPVSSFSVVVPFRNEQQNLPFLLECFEQLDYAREKFEILLVNDRSEDDSASIVKNFMERHPELSIRLFQKEESSHAPKKKAIEKAIEKSNHSWIITTDADCRFGANWLRAFDQRIAEQDLIMIVGPVTYDRFNSFLERFQLLDFLSLQGSTMGSFAYPGQRSLIKPFMCNGANLAYSKSAFKEVNGFDGNHEIASGDDVFLLQKMLKSHPEQVGYLKSYEALVRTSPAQDWKGLFQQRVRWASKTSSYDNRFGKMLGLLVLTVNLLLLFLPVLALFGHFPWALLGVLFLIKFNLDFVLIHRAAVFFEQREAMHSYFKASLFYPIFTVIVAIWSLRGNYTWKGRDY